MGSRSKHNQQRELTRDEVFVPPLRSLPEPWARDESYFNYLILKRSGWLGKLYVILMLVFAVAAWVTESTRLIAAIVVAIWLTFIAMLVVTFTSRKRRRSTAK